jgi:O-antigen/teichoic acid export membrane protein
MFGGRFVESSWLMPLIGLVAITSCWGTAFGVALRAMRASRTQLIAAGTTAVVGIPLALGLTATYGVQGAAVSAVVNYLLFSTMNARAYIRMRRQITDVERPATVCSASAVQPR